MKHDVVRMRRYAERVRGVITFDARADLGPDDLRELIDQARLRLCPGRTHRLRVSVIERDTDLVWTQVRIEVA